MVIEHGPPEKEKVILVGLARNSKDKPQEEESLKELGLYKKTSSVKSKI